ncbi:MAG TPA: CRISPR-associated endonuclease Cas2 [Anaerohalosphaeraceae bacterium]|nr:CRISPR-associated endonuclease Cas2 [Anaerohalosphaeraceae bacterium]HOL89461.1 CRISPR-associated endonuclease Cas2 [Anaerohalosphaeraceae bacterium]HPP55244.1 CRISPR-associated endonuclease Cas2 [Anaerohalosphaeraceae bacterium]
MFVVIAYDCTDDKRRLRVAKTLLDYGDRVQYSVFEADLDQALLKEMMQRLAQIINPQEDSIRIYHICQNCLVKTQFQGQGHLTQQETFFII